jgi:hypothetical protein
MNNEVMIQADDTRVISWFNLVNGYDKDENGRITEKNKCNTNGYLYVIQGGDGYRIQPWLPKSLIEFANASSGTSGGRPVGIRTGHFASAEQAADEISYIFSSPETIAEFLNKSECDYAGPSVKVLQEPAEPMANPTFWNIYNKFVMAYIVKKHGRADVEQAYQVLTMTEFETKYGLTPDMAQAFQQGQPQPA